MAASILYRALLDDILTHARSKTYGHGATYLGKLTLLADDADAARAPANTPATPHILPGSN